MVRSKIAGIGMYVPQHVVTNNDLRKYMGYSDEVDSGTYRYQRKKVRRPDGRDYHTMGVEAAKIAIERAGLQCRYTL